jgi:serine/threonine-protein kinase
MAMRYVEGADLRALLHEADPPGAEELLELVAQVAGALDAAHARGLVHRDVKPRNILVGRDQHAYLADFGVSTSSTGSAPAAAGPAR